MSSALQPKRTKYNKMFKPVLKGAGDSFIIPSNGTYGLKVLENGFISAAQIESARKLIKKKIKKRGLLWVNLFPNVSMTTKTIGARMGKGKGSHAYWAAPAKKGQIILEIKGLSLKSSRDLFKIVSIRIPLKTKFVVTRV